MKKETQRFWVSPAVGETRGHGCTVRASRGEKKEIVLRGEAYRSSFSSLCAISVHAPLVQLLLLHLRQLLARDTRGNREKEESRRLLQPIESQGEREIATASFFGLYIFHECRESFSSSGTKSLARRKKLGKLPTTAAATVAALLSWRGGRLARNERARKK